ncbi:REP-associated tyrosine transposase [Pontiella desulfatans]|uniref:REP-associated tyrosine transposase n=1 Tax=Pontiella desulfatans TaxID=2750659 RepID=A0A6C2U421_PONDE|nr:transposase [Pontiella desulfatans]VGO14136.1 REP-associated tyrosine transposase [Pontiella desulfatans]
MLPERKTLPHGIPSWVEDGAEYFITINTQPKGKNQLCTNEVADVLYRSLIFYQERGDLWLHLLVLMPDHLHAIMSFNRDVGMLKSIKEFKKYTARMLGVSWQCDFFDHRLRKDESYIEKAHYIRMNPVRAGLCVQPEDWPYVWENRPG